jgi:hypothetical protein
MTQVDQFFMSPPDQFLMSFDINHGSAVERELVLRLASVLWRLRRTTGIETALFESVTEDSRKHEHRPLRENNLLLPPDLRKQNKALK